MRKYEPSTPSAAVPCLMESWHLSESEIYHWLLKHTSDPQLSFDLLQDTFLKALQQKQNFCDILNQRAWLYTVTRNLLIDRQRRAKQELNLPALDCEPLWVEQEQELAAIDSLAQCIPKALKKLSFSERQIIQQCDLQGMSQQGFASEHGLTLVATKSRIQRARIKLKHTLQSQCHIQFDEQQRVCCFFKE